MSMKLTNEPLAKLVIADLDDVPPVLHEVTEKATTEARSFFEIRGEPVNSYLFPCLVRYFAMTMLNQPTYRNAGYVLVGLSNNGLFLVYEKSGKSYRIRILKADEEGELPSHNLSDTKRAFYNNPNPYLPGLDWGVLNDDARPSGLNLVALWDVNSAYSLSSLQLVCPDGVAGSVHFVANIPHSATAIVSSESFDETPEELEDIDIALKRTESESDD